jgi:hypothetical protein
MAGRCLSSGQGVGHCAGVVVDLIFASGQPPRARTHKRDSRWTDDVIQGFRQEESFGSEFVLADGRTICSA